MLTGLSLVTLCLLASVIADLKSSEKPKKRAGKKVDIGVEMYEAIGSLSFMPADGQMLLHSNMQSLMSYNPMEMHGMHLMHPGGLVYLTENAVPCSSNYNNSSSCSSNMVSMEHNGDNTVKPERVMNNSSSSNNNNSNSANKFTKTPVSQYNLRNHAVHTADSTADYLNQSLDSLDSGELNAYRYTITYMYYQMKTFS